MVRILGFKLSRYRQWWEVLADEFGQCHSVRQRVKLTLAMLKPVFCNSRHSRKEWFLRTRRCYRCPVFDRALRRCGPPEPDYRTIGCGCWSPLANVWKTHGWLTEALGDPDHLCW